MKRTETKTSRKGKEDEESKDWRRRKRQEAVIKGWRQGGKQKKYRKGGGQRLNEKNRKNRREKKAEWRQEHREDKDNDDKNRTKKKKRENCSKLPWDKPELCEGILFDPPEAEGGEPWASGHNTQPWRSASRGGNSIGTNVHDAKPGTKPNQRSWKPQATRDASKCFMQQPETKWNTGRRSNGRLKVNLASFHYSRRWCETDGETKLDR